MIASINNLKLQALVILIICLTAVNTQRGGSNSDADNRDHNWDNKYDELDDRNPTQNEDEPQTNNYWIAIGMVAVFAGIVMYNSKNSEKANKDRKLKIQKLFSQWQDKNQKNACTLSKQQIQAYKNGFLNKKWQIRFQSSNGSVMDDGPVKFLQFSQRSQFSYNLNFQMHDNLGKSQCNGILKFETNQAILIFQKTYISRSDAGQDGSFDLLLYEGVQRGEKYRGQWRYQGYEGNQQYSGKWQLLVNDQL